MKIKYVGAPYVKGSATSLEAAKAIVLHAGTARAKVYDFIESCGGHGATDEEVQEDLDLPYSTSRPRRVELVTAGLVKATSRKRRTNSGRRAVVWVTTN